MHDKEIVKMGVMLGVLATVVVVIFKMLPLSEDTTTFVKASTLTLSFFYGWQHMNYRGRELIVFAVAWIITEIIALTAFSIVL